MKTIIENHCIAIKEADPDTFAKKYQEALNGVARKEVLKQYSDGYFIAVITWETERHEAETAADDFHQRGIRYTCGQCPHLQNDGDKRRKQHPCKYSEYGTARIDSECCDVFYKQLMQGKVVPVF